MSSANKISPGEMDAAEAYAAEQQVSWNMSDTRRSSKDGIDFERQDVIEDIEALEEYVRELRAGSIAATPDDKYDVSNYYKKDSVFSRIASSKRFEYSTLTVIVINALWIGHDSDSNIAPDISTSKMKFVWVENFFCFYFTIEVMIRFSAFQRKANCRKDFWFVFDSTLVTFMVLETWLIPVLLSGGGSSGLGDVAALRLLRLARLTRMVRLMRAVPELVTLIKGMSRAASSVAATLALLLIFLYVFGLIFVMQYGDPIQDQADGLIDNCPDCSELWGSVGSAVFTLFVAGTLLDDCTAVTNGILGGPVSYMIAIWFLFVLLSSFTVLNMLIGVLCEVVTETAQSEAEKSVISQVGQSLVEVFAELDEDHSGKISKDEFDVMKENEKVQEALDMLGIETRHLVALGESIFGGAGKEHKRPGEEEETAKELGFTDFLEMAVHLRPENKATVFDLIQMRKQIDDMGVSLEERILEMEGALMRVALAPENVIISKLHGEVEILRSTIKERMDLLQTLDMDVHEKKKEVDQLRKDWKEQLANSRAKSSSKSDPQAVHEDARGKSFIGKMGTYLKLPSFISAPSMGRNRSAGVSDSESSMPDVGLSPDSSPTSSRANIVGKK